MIRQVDQIDFDRIDVGIDVVAGVAGFILAGFIHAED